MRRGYPLYAYRPSQAAAIIFCLFFIVTTILHLWQMIRRKSWFMTALVIGGAAEFIGYACRAASAAQLFNNYTIFPFALQNSYILLAPALFAASIYMVLGRVILLTNGESHSLVRRRWLTMAFVCGDILCFAAQGGGGSPSTVAAFSGDGRGSFIRTAGKALTILGLVMQLIIFAGFICVAAVFHQRINKRPAAVSVLASISECWRRCMTVVYIVSGLIMLRNIVRVVGYCKGQGGYIWGHEAFLYVFDGLLMFVALVVLNVVHPGGLSILLGKADRIISESGDEFISSEPLHKRGLGEEPGDGIHKKSKSGVSVNHRLQE